MKWPIKLLFLFLIFLSGCAYLGYLKDPFTDIPAFASVTDNIYRGGYPKGAGYGRLKDLGVKTIINLAGNDRRFRREQEAAEKYGFSLVHIPLSVYRRPSDEEALLFLKTVLTRDNLPVFVHCTSGRDRTGAMVAVYRTVVGKKGPKESYKEALRYGFWPYRGETVLKDYIHQLKDRKVLFDFVREYYESNADAAK